MDIYSCIHGYMSNCMLDIPMDICFLVRETVMRRPGWNQRTRENPTRPLNLFYGLIQYTVVPPDADRHWKPTASKED